MVVCPRPDGKAQFNPDISSNAGMVPLVYALQRKELDIARTLLDHGAKVDRADGDGHTPIVAAIHGADVAALTLLLEYGARFNERRNRHMDFTDGNIVDFTDFTALDLAKMEGDAAVIDCLVNSKRGKLLRRMHKLRRLAANVGKAASVLQSIYTEVTFRPGNQGQKRSREEFEATAALERA